MNFIKQYLLPYVNPISDAIAEIWIALEHFNHEKVSGPTGCLY